MNRPRTSLVLRALLLQLVPAFLVLGEAAFAANKVEFSAESGTCHVNGTPFFPIGIWTYNLDPAVMADLHEHRFNTIVGGGFKPSDMPLIEKHGMMCIPNASDDFLKAAEESPSLLAWYLIDEPEEHNTAPDDVRRMYDALKAKDFGHPIGITHCQLAGPPKYKGSCDFTMTDVYPVTRDRDWPLKAVGRYTEGPREVHGKAWPNLTFVQTFGGPDTDGGKWAQPLPHEIRFMAFNALIHRTNGILYFSYWPRAALSWEAVGKVNRDIERIVPWLIAPEGEEKSARSSDAAVEIRARKVGESSWLIIALNTEPRPCTATLSVEGMGEVELRAAYLPRTIRSKAGEYREHFAAYEEKVYLTGPEVPWP